MYEEGSGWKQSGRNGGVQLLHLRHMRASSEYNSALDAYGRGELGRIGYLGDQTLYTVMASKWPALFHHVGCEWNRQISPHFGFKNATLHSCPKPCAILHANDHRLKCIAAEMQTHLASCKVWHDFVGNSVKQLPRPNVPTPSKCAFHDNNPHPFASAMRTFYWDCCLP